MILRLAVAATHDHRDTRRPAVGDRLLRLRLHPIVGRHHNDRPQDPSLWGIVFLRKKNSKKSLTNVVFFRGITYDVFVGFYSHGILCSYNVCIALHMAPQQAKIP